MVFFIEKSFFCGLKINHFHRAVNKKNKFAMEINKKMNFKRSEKPRIRPARPKIYFFDDFSCSAYR